MNWENVPYRTREKQKNENFERNEHPCPDVHMTTCSPPSNAIAELQRTQTITALIDYALCSGVLGMLHGPEDALAAEKQWPGRNREIGSAPLRLSDSSTSGGSFLSVPTLNASTFDRKRKNAKFNALVLRLTTENALSPSDSKNKRIIARTQQRS